MFRDAQQSAQLGELMLDAREQEALGTLKSAVDAALRDERGDTSGARSGHLTLRIRPEGSKRRRAVEQAGGRRTDRVVREREAEQDDITSTHALRWGRQAERYAQDVGGTDRVGGCRPNACSENE